MSQSQISTWLDFALQQIATESYLDDPGGLLAQLTRGNNRIGFDPPTGPLLGATRFTNVLADRFIAKYDIVDHAMAAIERDNPSLKTVLPKDFGRVGLDKIRLGQIITKVSKVRHH